MKTFCVIVCINLNLLNLETVSFEHYTEICQVSLYFKTFNFADSADVGLFDVGDKYQTVCW